MDDAPRKREIVRVPKIINRLEYRKAFNQPLAMRPARFASLELRGGLWAVVEVALVFATEAEADTIARKLTDRERRRKG